MAYMFKINADTIGTVNRVTETLSPKQGDPEVFTRHLNAQFTIADQNARDQLLEKAKEYFQQSQEFDLSVIDGAGNVVFFSDRYTYLYDCQVTFTATNDDDSLEGTFSFSEYVE